MEMMIHFNKIIRTSLCLLFIFILTGSVIGATYTDYYENPDEWYKQGVSEFFLKHYDRALEFLEITLMQNPQHAGAWYWKGITLNALGRTAEAKSAYAKAEEIDPYISDPYRKKVGALADVVVTSVPTLRPTEKPEDDEMIKTDIDLTKKPDPTGPDIAFKEFNAVWDESSNQLRIAFKIANEGFKPTREFYISFYSSPDKNITTEDNAIGYYLIQNLLKDTVGEYEGYISPQKLSPGSYYIGAIADQINSIMEVSENNNAVSTTSKVVIPESFTQDYRSTLGNPPLVIEKSSVIKETLAKRPDLTIESVTSVINGTPGETIPVNATIKNVGDGLAGEFTVSMYLSKDVTISEDDILLGEGQVSDLGAGLSRTSSSMVTIPNNIEPGTYYLGVVIDSEFVIIESDESNNVRFAETGALKITSQNTPIQVTQTEEPIAATDKKIDLTVVEVTTEGQAHAGDDISVNTTIKNDGDVDAGSFIVGLYLSPNNTITKDNTLLALGTIENLPAGLVRTGTAMAGIPANLTPGEYYIGIIIDTEDVITEKDKINNIGVSKNPIIIS